MLLQGRMTANESQVDPSVMAITEVAGTETSLPGALAEQQPTKEEQDENQAELLPYALVLNKQVTVQSEQVRTCMACGQPVTWQSAYAAGANQCLYCS